MTDDARRSDSVHSMTREIAPRNARPRRRLRWLRATVWSLVGLGVLGGVTYAALPKPTLVDVGVATEAPLTVTIDELGRTRVRDKFIVSSPLMAHAARIALRPGDHVRVGTELVRLSPLSPALLDPRARSQASARLDAASAMERQARATLARAELASENARADAAVAEELARDGATTAESARHAGLEARLRDEDLSSARFGVQVAVHEVEVARAAVDRAGAVTPGGADELVLRSPIDGVVLRVMHESEGAVQVSTPLLEVGDVGALEITADLLTADAVRVPERAAVRIRRWGGDADLEGHVRRVEPSAFTKLSALGVEEQRVLVVMDLDRPEEASRLGDGFRVEASIELWSAPSVLVAPMTALFREGATFAVYSVEDGRAHLTRVELGHRGATAVEVLSGLSPGATVIEHPGPKVVDGARVRPR